MQSPDRTTPSEIVRAASLAPERILTDLGSSETTGLQPQEAAHRLQQHGPNVLRVHRARAWVVFGRQLKNPILILLVSTVAVSLWLGDVANSIVIGIIIALSVGLGFFTEFRAERAAEELHNRVKHRCVVNRGDTPVEIDVQDLVPGDVIYLGLGSVVPADIRLLKVNDLECDESILTGESMAVSKSVEAVAEGTDLADLTSVALMGTIVHAGEGKGVVVSTGSDTEFGRIATSLGESQPETDFQQGLRRFSLFLLWVALALTTIIFVGNVLLQRPLIESLMFSLAIAVGMTPQLLPAVVSTGLALGSRKLAKLGVLVKRLVSIEDLGDIDVLVTDKTGTLTLGEISFVSSIALSSDDPVEWGLLAADIDYADPTASLPHLNAIDAALVSARAATPGRPPHLSAYTQLDSRPFDHDRRISSVLVRTTGARAEYVVAKGSPEDIFTRCATVSAEAHQQLEAQYAQGARVIAVARAPKKSGVTITDGDERGLSLIGFLIFSDPPKESARASLAELADLGISVKIATGDNAMVAEKVAADLGLDLGATLTGHDIDQLSEAELRTRVRGTGIYARVSPEQKGRVLRALRAEGFAVGFLGDGVNDAVALHDADVGISVDTAADVAKDAADIVLLEKDLGVLARGVEKGREVFSNTMKYVLMGTSSNFGNMFSASFGSLMLNFLPMLPGQVLLNNMMYDTSQLAIPTDNVDREQVLRPSHWNIALIRRFMLIFGPISSLFDFATFGLMLFVFHAGEPEFQSGWFVESLATETLIVFAIRTRRTPFFRSRPSWGLALSVLSIVAIGCYLPYSPVAELLGFSPLPLPFFGALVVMIALYLSIVEVAKYYFFRNMVRRQSVRHIPRPRTRSHQVGRRAARFSTSSRALGSRASRASSHGRAVRQWIPSDQSLS